jgi:hypothetical protein
VGEEEEAMMKDQVRNERGAGHLWDVWVKQGILTQDRGRGESPLRHWRRHDSKESLRQKRIDYLTAMFGSPKAQRAMAHRDRRIREIRRSV